jgi:hypothetical protein
MTFGWGGGAPVAISFVVRPSRNDDFDDVNRTWRCSALNVPGAAVEDIYSGEKVDSAHYEVLGDKTIRWLPKEVPERIGVAVKLTEALSLGAETEKWKKIAIIVPVITALIGAIGAYVSQQHGGGSNGSSGAAKPTITIVSSSLLASGASCVDPVKSQKKLADFCRGHPQCVIDSAIESYCDPPGVSPNDGKWMFSVSANCGENSAALSHSAPGGTKIKIDCGPPASISRQ